MKTQLMSAEVLFCCRSNSHPFTERRVTLNEPTKIGRSVAKCRPSSNNSVFDCKVLSRNHALLWFENGKFYLQDTKSSNGTFINNQRLSRTSEESPPVEVNSCDIVQFGVDVVDTTKKVTHGCIVSQLRLFLPNGEESKPIDRPVGTFIDKVSSDTLLPPIQFEDLYQLQQYLKEALHREQMLEQKLALLQRHIDEGQEASANGWQAVINEDKLLSKLEFLENQLQLYKTQDESELQTKLQQLEEEKFNYENTSKETLRQALSEKLEAVQKVTNLESMLGNLEDECTHYCMSRDDAKKSLTQLSTVHRKKLKDFEELQEVLKETENKSQELKLKIEELTKSNEEEGEEYCSNTKQLQSQVSSLRAEIEALRNTKDEKTHAEAGTQVEKEICSNQIVVFNDSNETPRLHKDEGPSYGDSKNKFEEPFKEAVCEDQVTIYENGTNYEDSYERDTVTISSDLKEDNLIKQEEEEINRLSASSDHLSTSQNDPEVAVETSSSKHKTSKKASLILKMPVKFGKKNSKKKSSSNEVADITSESLDVEELQRDLLKCKEELESRNLQVNKLERDLLRFQEPFKRFLGLNQTQNSPKNPNCSENEIEQTLSGYVELKERYSDLQDELNKAQNDLLASEERSAQLLKDISSRDQIIDEMTLKQSEFDEKIDELTKQLNDKKEEVIQLTKDFEEVCEQKETFCSELRTLQSTFERTDEEKKLIELEVIRLEKLRKSYEEEVQSGKARYEKMESEQVERQAHVEP